MNPRSILGLCWLLLLSLSPLKALPTPVSFAWQQEGYQSSSTTDKKGNVYALTAGYYDVGTPARLAKFGLFGNKIWEIDLAVTEIAKPTEVEVLPSGHPIVFGESASGRAGYVRLHSADGALLGGALANGLPVVDWTGAFGRLVHAVTPSGLVMIIVQPTSLSGSPIVAAWNAQDQRIWEHQAPYQTGGTDVAGACIDAGPTGQIWVAFRTPEGGLCRSLSPTNGSVMTETTFEFVPAGLMALSSGAVVAGRPALDSQFAVVRVKPTGEITPTFFPQPAGRIPEANLGYGRQTFCEDTRTGDIYWGQTSGNYADDRADGTTNGFTVVKIGREGAVKWEHRYQTIAISMMAPEMEMDSLGGLVVCGIGSQAHSFPRQGWCRLFRLSPEGTRFAETEPLLHFSAFDFQLNLGLLPVVSGRYFTQESPIRGSSLVQVPPLVPRGPILLSPPTVKRRSGQRFLTANVVGGRGPLTWRWYRNDRPIPGAVGAVKELPVTAGNREFPRDAYFVEVTDARGHGSVSATVQP